MQLEDLVKPPLFAFLKENWLTMQLLQPNVQNSSVNYLKVVKSH